MNAHFNLGMCHQFTALCKHHRVRLKFAHRNPWEFGAGEYDYYNDTIVINTNLPTGVILPIHYANVLCHELGHHQHRQRKNTIFPQIYDQASFRVRWLMEIVADNVGEKLFRKYFSRLGNYTRGSTTSDKLSQGYKQAKKVDYPYFHIDTDE